MPYYKEYFDNKSTEMSTVDHYGTVSKYPLVLEDCLMTGWRARPSKKAYYATEVADIAFDPYAYFLEQGSKARYQALLAQRPYLAAKGEPDRGHAFSLCKYTLDMQSSNPERRYQSYWDSSYQRFKINNPVFAPSISELGVTTDNPLAKRSLPSSNLDQFAQNAYLRSAPTATRFDAGQFLGELREGLPSLGLASLRAISRSGMKDWKEASRDIASSYGSDTLNIQFGWKPLLNDLVKLGSALRDATAQLSGNGERKHRRYGTPENVTSYEKRSSSPVQLYNYLGSVGNREVAFGLPSNSGFGIGPAGQYYFLRTSSRVQWFEGEFTNFFKLGFDPESYWDKLEVLLDPRITVKTLWELAPWSWLVDWYLRIGDSIAANELNANDKLVMHYGYAMERTILRDLISITYSETTTPPPVGQAGYYWAGLPATQTYVATTEYKRRIRANPFGFRIGGTAALTADQLGILGALGLTKLK